MRCHKCGCENPDDAIFCTRCGRKLEETSEKICPNCGAKNLSDSVFCSECGNMLEYKKEEHVEQVIVPKERMSTFAIVCLIVAILGAAFTLFAYGEVVALIGLTISAISLILIAVGLLLNKIKGNIKIAIGLGIYGVLGNIIWLAFILWMLPNF